MTNKERLEDLEFLTLKHIIGDKNSIPPLSAIIPISRTSWLIGVKKGIYPKPIKIGRKVVWRPEDIKNLISSF